MNYISGVLLLIFAISLSCSTRKETEIDPEAQRKAQEWLDGIIANCDGKYFVGVPSFNIEELKEFYGGKLQIQLREPELKFKDSPLSDKDRYEGEEWSGFFSIKSKGWRYYNEKPPDDTWSDWRSSEPWHRDPLGEKAPFKCWESRKTESGRFGQRCSPNLSVPKSHHYRTQDLIPADGALSRSTYLRFWGFRNETRLFSVEG